MRTFKFRAFIKGVNVMLNGVAVYDSTLIGIEYDTFSAAIGDDMGIDDDCVKKISDDSHVMNLLQGEDWVYIRQGDYELMQFTGLKDKAGNEIYEGDIVSRDGAFVVWDDKLGCWCFQFKNSEQKPTPLFYGHNISKCEVIGNIYEHPDLLK